MKESGTRMGILGGGMSRRTMLRGASLGLGGVAGGMLVGCGDDGAKQVDLTDESLPPEVTTVRWGRWDGFSLCLAPIAIAPDFFAAEGLTPELVTLKETDSLSEVTGNGTMHFGQDFASGTVAGVASGHKVTFLAGLHSGCTEVFAREGINSVSDLAGKKIGVAFGDGADKSSYAFMVTLMGFIGLPANRTVVSYDAARLPGLLQSGELDAVVAVAPQGENLRGVKGLHVILSTTEDKPWADYYCCMLFGNSQFVKKNPIATKRVTRAVMKATDMLALEPERAAKRLLELGSLFDYEQTLGIVKHLPYGLWRTLEPEDSLRFYSLRLKEIGEIKRNPDQIIKHADWQFLNQLKRDMAYAPGFPEQRGAIALDCDIETRQGPVAS